MESGIPMAEYESDEVKITPDDLTERFGRLTGESNSNPAPMENQGAALLGLVLAVVMAIAFVLGRRAGRKKSTFVEVVRL
tara:strand:+ start:19977 stop:20216 length:240 start_codon:yes stop_codon:yes gene_type:complete